MDVITQILKACGPNIRGLYVKVENPPYLPLVIEEIQEIGPHRLPVVSVAHYGEQNGDPMRDPEMLFELEERGDDLLLKPFYFRNDFVGVAEYSVCNDGSSVVVNARLELEHKGFAALWGRNLNEQGFLRAFLNTSSQ